MSILTVIFVIIAILINIKSIRDSNKNYRQNDMKIKPKNKKENYSKSLKANNKTQTRPRKKSHMSLNKDKTIKTDRLIKSDKIKKIEKTMDKTELDPTSDYKSDLIEIEQIGKDSKNMEKSRGKDLILAYELMAGPLYKRKPNQTRPSSNK